ncbi:MAG: hypothetical protein JWP97_3875 [Labilithrix sp.]|nr:hypothetical protein [Labilithrix sp.]
MRFAIAERLPSVTSTLRFAAIGLSVLTALTACSSEAETAAPEAPGGERATQDGGDGSHAAADAGANPASCKVNVEEKRLYCDNQKNAPILAEPRTASPQVDSLETTFSWFDCWTTGDKTSKGNATWYRTTGDQHGVQGFVGSDELATVNAFDTGPKTGLPECAVPASGSAADLAKQLLALWGTRLTGNDVVKQDLTVASQGGTLNNSDTCHKTIKLDRGLLAALLMLTNKYDMFVDNIVTGHGCDQFFHPKGLASDLGGAKDRATGASTNFTPGTARDDKALDRSFVEYFSTILPDNAGLGQSECAGRTSAKVRAGVHYFDDTCTHQHVQMTY